MRLLKLFSRRKKKKELDEASVLPVKDTMEEDGNLLQTTSGEKKESEMDMESESAYLDSKKDREDYIRNQCERMVEAAKQIDDAKVEYEAVTSYLNDMQKIDLIEPEKRKIVDDAARNIVMYTREREKYKNSDVRLTPSQRQMMERYEHDILSELKNMQNNESYQQVIKSDLRYLEGEKAMLRYEKNEIIAKQKYLKGLSVTLSVLVVILFIVLAAVAKVFEVDMRLPFLMTAVMAVGSAVYILFESNRNRVNIKLNEQKMKKAITLLNKVKIKYVNNTSCLEYGYTKFGIKNSAELESVWKEYVTLKEVERRFRTNTDKLNENNELLIAELKKEHIADADIWIYQPAALIDRKEMVEIRHRLNVRRQKLRERIEYNAKIKNQSMESLNQMVKKKPELKEEILQIFHLYQLELDGNT
ncbi:hypothetical protein [Velocimicrobium porci]|uniref:Uncharacterized protein n=1 Tax=Velocimicrobium porci TaxID=2606634 RepID=A0A6L5XYI4_9FIRM|nr:hypothetical protein [Velocimicrobium porci]MSS63511.1 hypothetical protein [Velocimicrobium porci]